MQGMPQEQAHRNGNSRKGYWAIAGSGILTRAITNKRLAAAGYFEILNYREPSRLCDPAAVYRTVHTVV